MTVCALIALVVVLGTLMDCFPWLVRRLPASSGDETASINESSSAAQSVLLHLDECAISRDSQLYWLSLVMSVKLHTCSWKYPSGYQCDMHVGLFRN